MSYGLCPSSRRNDLPDHITLDCAIGSTCPTKSPFSPAVDRGPLVFTTRPYFTRSLGPDPGRIAIPAQTPFVSIRKASPGLMAILCEGRRGEGFYLCGYCGAAFRKPEKRHKTAQAQHSGGTLHQVSLRAISSKPSNSNSCRNQVESPTGSGSRTLQPMRSY